MPAGARVINATGKFVLPGLWESQTAYSWYFGEALLNHGITSSIDVGTEAEVAPRDPVEPEVDALDEHVLRDDPPSCKLGGVVLDPLGETATLQLREQPELADVSEPRSR